VAAPAATWPTEDYELVHSEVRTELPEDDLFAGIRGREGTLES
jgi:mycothiol S-conjugate amidase